jgi:lipopolysaccharide export LptBFGC system permease protein LptF
MNPRYRFIYLLFGFAGLAFLIYHIVSTFSETLNPGAILLIAVPDLVFFFLAYKTYPIESEVKR